MNYASLSLQGMDVDWPYQRRLLGDTLTYNCPMSTTTWKTYATSQQVIMTTAFTAEKILGDSSSAVTFQQ
jgi:hypothetical protein